MKSYKCHKVSLEISHWCSLWRKKSDPNIISKLHIHIKVLKRRINKNFRIKILNALFFSCHLLNKKAVNCWQGNNMTCMKTTVIFLQNVDIAARIEKKHSEVEFNLIITRLQNRCRAGNKRKVFENFAKWITVGPWTIIYIFKK